MIKIIGVRFRKAGKIYYFNPKHYDISKGDHVIVETARGIEYGTVVLEPKNVTDDEVIQPLKPVLRMATPEDDEINEKNRIKEREAFKICQQKIRKHDLEMKLIDTEYTFDNNKVLFYFTADGRIDFRELVKDLAAVFKTRIELRQIGVRDETKILGGIGICGRPLCCHCYLTDFVPVSIKMAKEQDLSLNPTKISGTCGRLMCCLKNEQDTYEYLNCKMPRVGDTVETMDGIKGEVTNTNVLRQRVKILIVNGDEKELREYPVDELKFKCRRRCGEQDTAENIETEESEELKELEALELQDDREQKEEERKKEKNYKKDKFYQKDRSNREKGHFKEEIREQEIKTKGEVPEGKSEPRTENRENNKKERFDRRNKKEHFERKEKFDKRDRFDKKERFDKRESFERKEKFEKRENFDKNDYFEKRDKIDKKGNFDKKRYEKRERFERKEKFGKKEKYERKDRIERKPKSNGSQDTKK